MLGKKFLKSEILQEYIGNLKIVYQSDSLTISNYHHIYSIGNNVVILEEIKVIGEELKVVYQDKVKIIIKGKITNVTKGIKGV